MASWAKVYSGMIDECEELESRLPDWERGFLGSVRKQLDSGDILSEKQTDKLEALHTRVTQ